MKIIRTFYALALSLSVISANHLIAQENKVQDEKAYREVLNQRSDKIVKDLNIADSRKAAKVKSLIANQYYDLNTIQQERDVKLKSAKSEIETNAIKKDSDNKIDKLHKKYIASLSSNLSKEQIELVKDGMTYNVVPGTFRNYLLMLPYLSQEHQARIKASLIEAREHAMDGSSSKEKHGWFGKYKGKITNYLTADGYNLKKEGDNWAKRRNLKSTELPITESNRIVALLKITDPEKNESVRNLLAHQYQFIQELQAERDEKMNAAKNQTGKSKEEADKEASAIWDGYKVKFDDQRKRFTQLLSTIAPEKVEMVKNEMTDNNLEREYTHFQALLPTLTEVQKKQVYDYLLEARDNAMNVLNAKERLKWFIKFRGRANNYLAKQGYNLRKATEDLEKKLQSQADTKN